VFAGTTVRCPTWLVASPPGRSALLQTRFEFGVSFQQVDCARCGAIRAVGSACPDCGARPRPGAVDAHVVRRSQAIAQAERSRDEIYSEIVATPTLVEPAALRRLLRELLQSLQEVLSDHRSDIGKQRLGRALAELALAQQSTRLLPARRPTVSRRNATIHALDALALAWESYRRAVTTPDPLVAQYAAREAQLLLDRSFDEYARLAENMAAMAAYDATSSPLFERTMNVLSVSEPGLGVLELARREASTASARLGMPIDLAHGLQYSLLEIVGSTVFDEEIFHRKLAGAADLCKGSTVMASVASQPRAVESLARGVGALYVALQEFELLIPHARTDGDIARRIMRLYTDVFEEIGLPLFVWYLLLTGSKSAPFEKLIKENATTLERRASELFPDVFSPAMGFLRNAAQHGHSYTFEAGYFHFSLNTFSEPVPLDAVVDELYAFLESMAAANFALTSTLSTHGIKVDLASSDLERLGVTPKVSAELWLADKGMEPVITGFGDSGWSVQLKKGSECFAVAAVLACNDSVPSPLRVVSDPAAPELSVPRQSIRRAFGDREAAHDGLALCKLRREAVRDGQPLTERTEVAFLVAVHGSKLLDGDVASARLVREAARLAEGLWFESELKSLVSEIFRASRGDDTARERAQRSIRKAIIAGFPNPTITSQHVVVSSTAVGTEQ